MTRYETVYPFDDDPPPRREIPSGDLRGAPFGATTAAARIRREASRPHHGVNLRKHRRNLVIWMCSQVGLSQRQIAQVFGLSRSRVGDVLEEMQRSYDRA